MHEKDSLDSWQEEEENVSGQEAESTCRNSFYL